MEWIIDAKGEELVEGDRVRMSCAPDQEPEPCDYGILTSISDCDENGVFIVVEFDIPGWTEQQIKDFCEKYPNSLTAYRARFVPWYAEEFSGRWTGRYASYEDAPFQFEEVVKVK